MATEALQKKALMAVCACYYYDLANEAYAMTSEDLNMIIEKPYYCHLINDDDLHDCPEYQAEQAEILRDSLREEGINV